MREKFPNTERYSVSLRIQSECEKIRTRKNSVFEYFSRSSMKAPVMAYFNDLFWLKYKISIT